MFKDAQPLFEASITNDGLGGNSVGTRNQSCYEHLKQAGKDKDAIFYMEKESLHIEFPSGLLITDNDSGIIVSKKQKKDLDINKAKGELSVFANYLMRRGWNSSKLFIRSFGNELAQPLMQAFSQSAQDACHYISMETLQAYKKTGKSVA